VWIPANSVVPNFQLAVVIYGTRLLKKHQEVGKRFMVAYLKAVKQYKQGKTDRNLAILMKYTNLSRELLQEACWPPIQSDGQIQLESILEFQNWSLQKGLLDSIIPIEQFWDDRFIRFAHQELEDPSK
jgi:NitT/TauT family transport system substrate-binding protein